MPAIRSWAQAVVPVCVALALSGCTVRSYTTDQPRSDLSLTAGNRGFIGTAAPAGLPAEVKDTTRTVRVTEIELPILKPRRSRLSQPAPEQASPAPAVSASGAVPANTASTAGAATRMEEYTVAGGDNLEKIAKKFYGNPTQWKQIFEANREILKSPDKLWPGQVLKIPVASVKTDAQEQQLPAPVHAK